MNPISNRILAVLVFLAVFATNSKAQTDQVENRYIYCNVFLEPACFGISQGDSLNMQLPVDYLLYGIRFVFGGKAQIYSGFNPEGVDSNSLHISSNCGRKSDSCNLYKISWDRYRLLYEVDGDFLEITLSGISKDNFGQFNDFLHNFRYCNRSGSSVYCTEERVFENLQIVAPNK